MKSQTELQKRMLQILDAAVQEDGAFGGNVQLLNPRSGNLELCVYRNMSPEFVEAFQTVHTNDPSICGRTFRLGKRVSHFDVTLDR